MKLIVTVSLLLALTAPIAQAAETAPVAPSTPQPVAKATPTPTPTPSPTPSPSPTIAAVAPVAEPVAATSAAPAVAVRSVESELAKVSTMLKAADYKGARSALLPLEKEFKNNAEINNLLGFSSRKLKDYTASAAYYIKALQINPNHLGALEYQGELFVVTKKLAAAKKNLKKIEQLAGKNSEQAIDLRKAIAGKKSKTY